MNSTLFNQICTLLTPQKNATSPPAVPVFVGSYPIRPSLDLKPAALPLHLRHWPSRDNCLTTVTVTSPWPWPCPGNCWCWTNIFLCLLCGRHLFSFLSSSPLRTAHLFDFQLQTLHQSDRKCSSKAAQRFQREGPPELGNKKT